MSKEKERAPEAEQVQEEVNENTEAAAEAAPETKEEPAAEENKLTELEQKSAFVDWNKEKRAVVYVLFGIHGFREDLQAIAKTRNDIILVK